MPLHKPEPHQPPLLASLSGRPDHAEFPPSLSYLMAVNPRIWGYSPLLLKISALAWPWPPLLRFPRLSRGFGPGIYQSYGSVGGERVQRAISVIDTHIASPLQGFEN